MFSRKIRIAILAAFTVCAATPTILQSQAKTTTTRRRARKPSRNRPPAIPAARYTTTRSPDDLSTTLANLAGKINGGMWGGMVVSLTRRRRSNASRIDDEAAHQLHRLRDFWSELSVQHRRAARWRGGTRWHTDRQLVHPRGW